MKKRFSISLSVLLICLAMVSTVLSAPTKAIAGSGGQGAIVWNTELETWGFFYDQETDLFAVAGLDRENICPNPPNVGELAIYHIVFLPQNDGLAMFTVKMDNMMTTIWDAARFNPDGDPWDFVCSQVAAGIDPLVKGVSSGTFMDTNPDSVPVPRAFSYGGESNGTGLSPNGEELKIQLVLRVIGKIYEDGNWEIKNNQIKISIK